MSGTFLTLRGFPARTTGGSYTAGREDLGSYTEHDNPQIVRRTSTDPTMFKSTKARFLLTVALAVASTCGTSSAGDIDSEFPELRPAFEESESYKLEFQSGPDFYLWYGHLVSRPSEKIGFGIYFGLHPNPSSRGMQTKKSKGIFAGQRVTWSQWQDKSEGTTVFWKETILVYDHGKRYLPIQVHAFLYADTAKDLERLTKDLENLRFEDHDASRAP